MNKYALLHIPESRYAFAVGEKEVVIRLRTSKEDQNLQVYLIYGVKYGYQTNQNKIEMHVKYADDLYQYYELKLALTDVRLAYVFYLEDETGSYYFSEDGVTEGYNFEEAFYNFFQLPYINKNDVMPTIDWMRDTVFYQIFVDRFYQGDHSKDTSYIDMKWGEKPTPKVHAGGDLKGIIEKMDYLKDLGISGIYLTPIFESKSNHKYDIKNYKKVDPQFGTTEDLVELVKQAHNRGIRVVLDAVFNHCSMEMAEFQDVLEKGKASPYYSWFLIDGDYPTPEKCNYECFASCNYMPKLNTAEEGVQEFLLDIATYWIDVADIDGWRLDVADEVSHEFWRMFRKTVKTRKKDCVIIGENWHDAYPSLQGDEQDSIMNYAYTKACLDYFARDRFGAKEMAEKLSSNYMRNMEQVNNMMLNLLDSHDTHRFFSEVSKDKKKLEAALALTMILPGTPCIYYGTEIATEGGYDPDCRRCFDWDQSHWDMALWNAIQGLIALRKNTTLKYGDLKLGVNGDLLQVIRRYEQEEIVLEINMTNKPQPAGVTEKNQILAGYESKGQIASEEYLIYKRGIERGINP